MIWLTWRQHRKALLFAIVALAVFGAVVLVVGLPLHRAYAESGLASCLERMAPTVDYRQPADPVTGLPDCGETAQRFSAEHTSNLTAAALLLVVPLLVGLFLGAPLVAREVERGTHRLVWTQGVTRLRWAATKFGLVAAMAIGLAIGYTLLASWFVEPIAGAYAARFEYVAFDLQGIAPVAYTLFALAAGIFAGTVWRRLLPAMAVTLVGFVAVRGLVGALRPHFVPPVRRQFPVVAESFPNPMVPDWILERNAYDGSGGFLAEGGDILCDPPCPEYPAAAYNVHIYQPAPIP